MKLPRITIVTPSYNQGQFIEDTIRSVLDQKYPNLEYMIFDGGSTDNSIDVIRKYEKQIDYWVSEKDRGQSHAINKGFEKATGDIVAWLNSDDFYLPGAFEYVARAYERHPEAGLIIGNGILADKTGRKVKTYSSGIRFDFNSLLKGSNYILQPSTFISNRALKEVGFVDESLYFAMDLDLWLRIGSKYPVVTIDKEFSAYRWYEEIKTAGGGFRRWVEQWHVMRKYTNDELTPGLLVEFFKVLQEADVQRGLGLNVEEIAKQNWMTFYNAMQQLLKTKDCIPQQSTCIHYSGEELIPSGENKTPQRTVEIPREKDTTRSSAIIGPRGTSSRIDLVFPEGHSWQVREGYAEALRAAGSLGKVFYVDAKRSNEELYRYLANPKSDHILLMNTDWHAQYLHDTPEWRKRWQECNAVKILFSFECMDNPTIKKNQRWWNDTLRAVDNAMQCVDGVVFAHEIDRGLFAKYGKPVLWQPFAVDGSIFPPPRKYSERNRKAFFKGKTTPFYYEDTYSERRRLIDALRSNPEVDVLDSYQESRGTTLERAQSFIREMNDYQIVLGLPSLSPTMVVRPFESMASGSVFFQNYIQGEFSKTLFKDMENIVMYDPADQEELSRKIHFVLSNPELGEAIAARGYEEVMSKHTIKHRVSDLITWVESGSFETAVPRQAGVREKEAVISSAAPKIIIDGVIFQFQKNKPAGISRVWNSLLNELSKTDLAPRILLLNRGKTAPKIEGINSIDVNEYNYQFFGGDSLYLQDICDRENAGLFISTYYSFPENTHSVLMLHDMIPEVMGADLTHPEWQAKTKAIEKANAYLSVSESTANDFRRLFPQYNDRKLYTVPNAVSENFKACKTDKVINFKKRYNIRKPYFLLVGDRTLYKNAILFFRAFALLENREDFEVFCAGGKDELESIFTAYVKDTQCQVHRLSEDELVAAYSGAYSFVYPSLYEGFGLPVLEAMSTGCPVITCRNSSLPGIAGDAALYVEDNSVSSMIEALKRIQDAGTRERLIRDGKERVKLFSWRKSGEKLTGALKELLESLRSVPQNEDNPIDTADALIYVLQKERDTELVARGMFNLILVMRHGAQVEMALLEQSEEAVATMSAQSFQQLSEIAQSSASDGMLKYFYALVLSRKRTYDKALAMFLEAYKQNVRHWRVLQLAGDAALAVGEKKIASSVYELVLERNPALHNVRLKLQQIISSTNPAGQSNVKRIGVKEKLVPGIQQAIAQIEGLREQGNFIGAIQVALSGLQNFPECISLQNLLAELHIQTGNEIEAERILFRVLKQDPQNVNALTNLGVIMSMGKDWPGAANYLNAALLIDPKNQVVSQNLRFVQEQVTNYRSKHTGNEEQKTPEAANVAM